ncbi:MAG: HlyD family efflux transporter periplasmic adaptor subunit [Saprospirales bacterium]|nr:HlyD family efflux transporter periplasmic adaptor subunit [Saprospirales bacterium]
MGRGGRAGHVGKPLYKIADLRHMELRAYITGAQLSSVKPGQKVEVFFDAGKETLQSLPGTVSWISSQAEFTPKIVQTRDERVNLVYALKIAVDNDGAVKIGMPGEVSLGWLNGLAANIIN